MSTAKAKPPEGCQGVAGQREPGSAAERGDVDCFPPDRLLGGSCRTAIPARWSLLEPVQI
jgi:hypothetical protein